MGKELAQTSVAGTIEQVLIGGDLTPLKPEERVSYYKKVCDSIGLNYLTKPFEYIKLNGRLVLYARKDATDQLRSIHKVSITSLKTEQVGDLYVAVAHARCADGREDEDMGTVPIKGLSGDNLGNAMLKAVTKAKRRVTLSLCGLGWLDETEVVAVPTAAPIVVDHATGEIIDVPDEPEKTPEYDPLSDLAWIKGRDACLHLATKEGHTVEDVLEYCGCDLTELTVDNLRDLYKDIREGKLRKAPA